MGLGVVGVSVVLVMYMISPSIKTKKESITIREAKEKEIKTLKVKIETIKNAKGPSEVKEKYYRAFETMMLENPPEAFYPPKIDEVFHQIYPNIKLSPASKFQLDPTLANVGDIYTRTGWKFTVEGLSYHELGQLMAKIENENPLWEFISIDMSAKAAPQFTNHNVSITLGTIHKKP